MLREREGRYGLGMDDLVSVRTLLWFGQACFGQRMLWEHECYGLACALRTRTLLWFGHGCFGQGMLRELECHYGLGMNVLVSVCPGNTNLIWFEHGCFGQRMLWAHERYYGLGMDALVSVCSGNTNVIMVWAWMLWSAYALGT